MTFSQSSTRIDLRWSGTTIRTEGREWNASSCKGELSTFPFFWGGLFFLEAGGLRPRDLESGRVGSRISDSSRGIPAIMSTAGGSWTSKKCRLAAQARGSSLIAW